MSTNQYRQQPIDPGPELPYLHKLTCVVCSDEFEYEDKTQEYCSDKCYDQIGGDK